MLFPIKKILICTDLTDQSLMVLKNAERIRQQLNAEADLIHVSDIGMRLEWASPDLKQQTYFESIIGGIGRDLLTKVSEQMQAAGLKATPRIVEGKAINRIQELSMEYDLLIIGHNKGGFFHHILGNVARKLLSTTNIPTIVIKRDFSFGKIAGLLDEYHKAEWVLSATFDFYRSMKFSHLEFITVWFDLPEPFHPEKKAILNEENIREEVKFFTREHEQPVIRFEPTRELQVAPHLARIIEEDKVDLAVMGRNRGKRANKLFLGSETIRMLELQTTNLLVLPV